jgi:hypothetical protein
MGAILGGHLPAMRGDGQRHLAMELQVEAN